MQIYLWRNTFKVIFSGIMDNQVRLELENYSYKSLLRKQGDIKKKNIEF